MSLGWGRRGCWKVEALEELVEGCPCVDDLGEAKTVREGTGLVGLDPAGILGWLVLVWSGPLLKALRRSRSPLSLIAWAPI